MKITVTEDNAGQRLDQFLMQALKDVPRAGIYSALRKGRVAVNGKKNKDPKLRVIIGDEVEFKTYYSSTYDHSGVVPVKQHFEVVYEDDYFMVINKPRGIAVHPGKNLSSGTLLSGLAYYGNDKGFSPFLTHRLDRDTSGLLIVAKSRESAREINLLFNRQKVDKEYFAVIFGKSPERDVISESLEGRRAVTEYVLEGWTAWKEGGLSLLRIKPGTGKKHQIRRHLSGAGLPLAGDKEYGIWSLNREFSREYGIKGFLLCCTSLSFPHPYESRVCRFTIKLPEVFIRLFPGFG
ncbi:MAG: RluA family pseudouridine synthase [Spirochaetales bacterium]|nr:RluA family pseudouridine synthase [Spirochaetales bacterium]